MAPKFDINSIDKEVAEQWVTRYKNGEPLFTLAKDFNRGSPTIRKVLVHYGVTIRPNGVPKPRRGVIKNDDGTVSVPLNGKYKYYAQIDPEDADLVAQYNWSCTPNVSPYSANTITYYAVSWLPATKEKLYLHRLITGAVNPIVIDHINGNGLDNRRSNLRVADDAKNSQNRRKGTNNTTGYKGVPALGKGRNRFRVCIQSDNELYTIGYYDDVLSAAIAYDQAAIRLHGEFANINFPLEAYGVRPWPITP